MLKIDIFDCNLTSWTLLKNGCRQNLSIMTNFESLICIQTEIEVITVCHFHSELFLNLNSVTKVTLVHDQLTLLVVCFE